MQNIKRENSNRNIVFKRDNPFPNKPLFLRVFSATFENTVGKGEIARYEQFLLFPQCFPPFRRTFCHQIQNYLQTLSLWKILKFDFLERVKVKRLSLTCVDSHINNLKLCINTQSNLKLCMDTYNIHSRLSLDIYRFTLGQVTYVLTLITPQNFGQCQTQMTISAFDE